MFTSLGPILSSSLERAPWGWATLVVLIGGYLKLKPLMIRLANEREKNLLEERAAEMASMRERMERLEQKLAIAEEEVRLVRHDLANTNQVFDFYIARVKADPKRAVEFADEVQARRDDQRRRLEEERATLRKARVAVITGHPS